MSRAEAFDQHRARMPLDPYPRFAMQCRERKTPGQERIDTRFPKHACIVSLVAVDFERKHLFGAGLIFPLHGGRGNPGASAGYGEIANDHQGTVR
jgi:hypothetical protein